MFSKSAKRSKHPTKITKKMSVCVCSTLGVFLLFSFFVSPFLLVVISTSFVLVCCYYLSVRLRPVVVAFPLLWRCQKVCQRQTTPGSEWWTNRSGAPSWSGVRGHWVLVTILLLLLFFVVFVPVSSWQVEHAAKCLLVPLSSANICVIRIFKPTRKNVFVSRQQKTICMRKVMLRNGEVLHTKNAVKKYLKYKQISAKEIM